MAQRNLQLPLLPPEWRSVTLEKVVPAENCFRHYQIVLSDTEAQPAVFTYHGRIGRTPRELREACRNAEEVTKRAYQRLRPRLLHGYGVVSFDV